MKTSIRGKEGTKVFAVLGILLVLIIIGSTVFTFLPMPGIRIPPYQSIWEISDDPSSMDPHVDDDRFAGAILFNVYETLYVHPKDDERVEPLLPMLAAESPLISSDSLNYTIRLRQNITFHDGTPFNASCVKWNIERAVKILSPGSLGMMLAEVLRGGRSVTAAAIANGTSSDMFKDAFDDWRENSSSIQVVDTYRVRLVLEERYSPFVQLLAHQVCSIMSPSFVLSSPNNDPVPEGGDWSEHYGADHGEIHTWMENHACGTGPYVLNEWSPHGNMRLELYGDYWRTDVSEAAISPSDNSGVFEEVIVKFDPDTTGRLLDLRTGSADYVCWPTQNAPEIWDNVSLSSSDPDIFVSTGGLSFELSFVGFNMANLTMTVDSTEVSTQSPFRNRHFRRAASFAFDYEGYIDKARYGFGTKAKGPIPQGMPGHHGSPFGFDYNITNAVMEWNLAMQDPKFVASLNNLDNRITFYNIETTTSDVRAEVYLVSGLQQVYSHPDANHSGLLDDMIFEVLAISSTEYRAYLELGRLPVVADCAAPGIAHAAWFIGSLCYHSGVWSEAIGYNNTDVNDWYENSLAEILPQVQMWYHELIQEAVAYDVPYIWISQSEEFRVWRAWLEGQGLTFNPMHGIYFYEIRAERHYPPPHNPYSSYAQYSLSILILLILFGYFMKPKDKEKSQWTIWVGIAILWLLLTVLSMPFFIFLI